MKINSKKIAFISILSALSLISFTIENLFPPIILPGAKLGISNIFILLTMILCGSCYAFIPLVVKTVLGSLFSGNISAIMYSLPSGIIALTMEILIYNFMKKTSVTAISITGAVINTTIQNVIFCLITETTEFFCYLPYLALIGVVAGLVVGIATYLIIRYIPENFLFSITDNPVPQDKGEQD